MKVVEKNKAIELRLLGWSYGKISDLLHVAKSTISKWCKNIELSEELQQKLAKNCRLNSILSGRRNKDRWEKVRAEMLAKYDPPFDDPQFMLGLGLYWGEGGKANQCTTSMSNCDPDLLRHFISWIYQFFSNDLFGISATVHHYDLDKDEEIKKYWSENLSLPAENFKKSILIISKASDKKKGNIQPYGTLHLKCVGDGVWKIRQKIEKAISMARSSIGRTSGFHPEKNGS